MKIMPYIAPEVVQEVKRMDLLTYLKNYEPQELVHFSGNTYTTRSHDSLKISNGKWMWWSQSIGGRSALDYLIKVRGYSFMEAIEIIAGQAAMHNPFFFPYPRNLRLQGSQICGIRGIFWRRKVMKSGCWI